MRRGENKNLNWPYIALPLKRYYTAKKRKTRNPNIEIRNNIKNQKRRPQQRRVRGLFSPLGNNRLGLPGRSAGLDGGAGAFGEDDLFAAGGNADQPFDVADNSSPFLVDGNTQSSAADGGNGGRGLDFKAGRRVDELFHAAEGLAQDLLDFDIADRPIKAKLAQGDFREAVQLNGASFEKGDGGRPTGFGLHFIVD